KLAAWNITKDREALYHMMSDMRAALHGILANSLKRKNAFPRTIDPEKKFEVHSVRPSYRTDWRGRPRFQWIIEITQRIGEKDPDFPRPDVEFDYFFRGGVTLIVDGEDGKVRFGIRKPLSDRRREMQRKYYLGQGNEGLAATYFGGV